MRIWQVLLALLGGLVLIYGLVNLFVHIPVTTLGWVAVWVVAATVIHHGLLSPLVVAVGVLIRGLLPDRGRRYLQAALITAAPATVIALPLIYRQGSQPPSKALLLQDFTANLGLLIGVIAALCLVGYAVRVARDTSATRGRRSLT